MRTARILLLALLALLLPLRGALAGAVVCAGHSDHGVVAAASAVPDDASAHQHPHSAHHATGCSDDALDGGDGTSVECATCAASCASSPLMAAVPVPASPSRFGDLPMSAHDAPAASHLSDGPERPPRVI